MALGIITPGSGSGMGMMSGITPSLAFVPQGDDSVLGTDLTMAALEGVTGGDGVSLSTGAMTALTDASVAIEGGDGGDGGGGE